MGDIPLPFMRTVLRTNDLTIMLSATHPLAAKKNLTLHDLEGQTLGIMSKADPCFLPLYRAIEKLSVHVNWKIVPDFYEAGYLMLQQNCLFIDRDENESIEQSH